VLDAFPAAMGIKDLVLLLSSVGFSDPPSWVRPFRVLSTGEQFRVTMARVLAEHALGAVAVVDEFTSVVDRTVAQIGSAALARTVRTRGQQFIAVTCHEDVEAWLTPDWVYRPATNEFHWRELQRPPAIELEICRVHRAAWVLFRHHHYLDTDLNPSAVCFVAFWQDRPVAFVAAIGFPHKISPGWRLHRLVCLPDYQGVGIGVALADFVSSVLRATAAHVFRTAAHPAVVAHCAKSPLWDMKRAPSMTPGSSADERRNKGVGAMKRAADRLTAGFEYAGPAADATLAAAMLGPR
jgi:GNAT superfamily N-acetyltransferase